MDLPERILKLLEGSASADSLKLAAEWKEDHQKLVGAIKSLECLGEVIQTEIRTVKKWELTDEAREVVKRGSHEAVVYAAVPQDGIKQPDLMKAVGAALGKVGFSKAMQAGWISIDKSSGQPLVRRKVDSIVDFVQQNLIAISKGSEVNNNAREEYKKRKLINEVVVKAYDLKKGPKFTTKIEKAATELTPDMIATGSWQKAEFKPFNFDALGIQPPAGHLHPLLKVRTEFRQIFLEMGFSEMPTNNFVESSFWNFDALFVPQKHPARDAQDTFFISDPLVSEDFPADYLERVKKVHSEGGYGSQGYNMEWREEETKKNVLRTHTTAVSARMLYKLAQEQKNNGGVFKPAKLFSIDRVFRNETLDATHLAEFHQIEGVFADHGVTLADLIGLLYEFFKKLGIEKLRFKAAYNPYTEPSMEIFSFHEGLKKWVEIGNSGVFRPEMIRPMGIPEGVNVLGWGLSLERPTMIKYGFNNIRELCGNKMNLKVVHDNPICRLDKVSRDPMASLVNVTNARWDSINEKLDSLSAKVKNLAQKAQIPISKKIDPNFKSSRASTSNPQKSESSSKSIVINADPSSPPFFLKPFVTSLTSVIPSLKASTHVHSSVLGKIPSSLYEFINVDCEEPELTLTLIWKRAHHLPSMFVAQGSNPIVGEADISRFLARILGERKSNLVPYETSLSGNDLDFLDGQIDLCSRLQYICNTKEQLKAIKELTSGKNAWVSGSTFSVADLLLWSYLQREESLREANKEWLNKCSKQDIIKSAL